MFNHTPRFADFADPELTRVATQMMAAPEADWAGANRKWWEWAMVLRAVEHYGFLDRDKLALGVGSGFEPPMFALANHLRMTVATDLYGDTAFSNHEASISMLQDPAQHAPFEFDRNGLLVHRMDATAIPYADNSFDVLFSCSSVEHFGPDARIVTAMREAFRVLRPGGIYAVSVDYLYATDLGKPRRKRKGPLGEFFTREEVMELVVNAAGFALAEDIDFDVDPAECRNYFDLEKWAPESGEYLPHIWLKLKNSYATSLFMVLFKP